MSFTDVLHTASIAGRLDIARAEKDGRAEWAYLAPGTTAPVAAWLEAHQPFRAVSGRVCNEVVEQR